MSRFRPESTIIFLHSIITWPICLLGVAVSDNSTIDDHSAIEDVSEIANVANNLDIDNIDQVIEKGFKRLTTTLTLLTFKHSTTTSLNPINS
ncbi:hypothetical protein HZH68_003641 [Vespula germanica]|uniref:Uncharacterized protein n=1 Tax=Vespula germanica TaxID=30212 RepID=A0A834U3G0_VESGE|nr:hypothetical protein HZH68_003641 [Vespula germanica]